MNRGFTAMVRSLLVAIGATGWEQVAMQVDPREWHPRHQLDRIQTDVTMSRDGSVQITVIGRSAGQRADLWRHSETVGADEHSMVAPDKVHQLLVAAIQDRPRTAQALSDAVTGQGWEDVPLPY